MLHHHLARAPGAIVFLIQRIRHGFGRSDWAATRGPSLRTTADDFSASPRRQPDGLDRVGIQDLFPRCAGGRAESAADPPDRGFAAARARAGFRRPRPGRHPPRWNGEASGGFVGLDPDECVRLHGSSKDLDHAPGMDRASPLPSTHMMGKASTCRRDPPAASSIPHGTRT